MKSNIDTEVCACVLVYLFFDRYAAVTGANSFQRPFQVRPFSHIILQKRVPSVSVELWAPSSVQALNNSLQFFLEESKVKLLHRFTFRNYG